MLKPPCWAPCSTRGVGLLRAYREAALARTGPYELHETPVGVMADLVEQVVKIESPVHVDEVIVRLRTAWGLQRAGARIEAAVEQGVDLALKRGRLSREGGFLSMVGEVPLPRDRGNSLSQSLRKLEMISPLEIAAGVVHVVATNLGATDDEVALTISRMLGFKATSASLRKHIGSVVEDLVVAGRLRREDQMIVSQVNPGA